jgi:hypothetical protein
VGLAWTTAVCGQGQSPTLSIHARPRKQLLPAPSVSQERKPQASVSHLCQGPALDTGPPAYASLVAGITPMYDHALFVG